MRSSDSLFRLIKAMSKGDRRNFKLFAKLQDGDKKYVQLFDAIDKQEEYDEKALLEQFKGERFTNQFSVAKNYLYNYILKTLHVFHKDQYTDLSTLMHQIQILIGKSLFDQAQKLIRKGKHMAERQERFQEVLYLLQFERMVLHRLKQTKQYNAFIDSIQSQEKKALNQLENLQAFHHLFDEIYLLRNKAPVARSEADHTRVEAILADPIFTLSENPLSIRGKLRMLDVLNECHMFKNDFASCLGYASLIIKTYEENPVIRREKNLRYINVMSDYCVYSYSLGYKEEALVMLGKMKDLETFSEEERIRVFEKYFHFKVALSIESEDIEAGRKTVQEIEREFAAVEGKIMKGVELGVFYMAAYFYIRVGEPSSALNWINKILNEPKTELRTDLQCMARILNLVVHYQLGNREFVEYNVKSTTRFLTNRDCLFQFERTTLKYLRLLAVLHPDESAEGTLHKFKNDIELVLESESEQKALNLFDVPTWIDSLIRDCSMAEAAKQDKITAK